MLCVSLPYGAPSMSVTEKLKPNRSQLHQRILGTVLHQGKIYYGVLSDLVV